jgi:hypothetical protein
VAAQDLDSAIKTIASRTTRTEFKKIKSVMYGLFAGVDFGFDDSGLNLKMKNNQQNKSFGERFCSVLLKMLSTLELSVRSWFLNIKLIYGLLADRLILTLCVISLVMMALIYKMLIFGW